MKTQRCLSLLYRSIFALAAFVLLFQNVFGREILDNAKLGEMERVEATLTRRALPKWLQELPDSIPFWMKRAASKYRGAPHQILCAVVKLGKALNDMKAAKARNCDNYFRCRGSFDAAQCGVYAAAFASNIRYKQEWRTGGMDRHYDSRADLFGSLGGDCLYQYKYKTYGTAKQCNVPWYYHK